MTKVKPVRRKYSAGFKSEAATGALRERATLSDLIKRYELLPSLITKWKRALILNSFLIFEDAYPEKMERISC